jgi:hypothetical protein
MTTSPEVGASRAAEILRAQAASYRFAAPVKISADDLQRGKRTITGIESHQVWIVGSEILSGE